MKHINQLLLALFVWCGATALCSGAETNGISLITDKAEVLTPEQHKQLSALLLAYNTKGPGRITVFIAKELPPGTTIDKFAKDKISEWPIAVNENADRILIAVALHDRKLRIETSRELWAVLPDSFCRDVIDQKITPEFKEKRYFEGIYAGISALATKLGQSETDPHAAASTLSFGSPEWKKAAAEDISVRIVAVLQRPSQSLSWSNEREMLQLKQQEKDAITKSGVSGELEVVYTTGRGSGSREVRVVIIQTSPLSANAVLPVPETGSFIYIQDHGSLKPLFTNSVASSLKLEIYQQKRDTVFFMDYPRDRVRSGGAVFWWDENGKWHAL